MRPFSSPKAIVSYGHEPFVVGPFCCLLKFVGQSTPPIRMEVGPLFDDERATLPANQEANAEYARRRTPRYNDEGFVV